MNKKDLRKSIKEKLIKHDFSSKMESNKLAEEVLIKFLEENYPKSNIALFSSLDEEIETGDIINTLLLKGFNVSVPRVEGKDIYFYPLGKEGGDFFDISEYGIREPLGFEDDRVCDDIDVIIVPGLAFDKDGFRLGRGKGFYDRFLTKHKNLIKIGYGYDFQLIDKVPTEPHDIRMDYIITPNNLISIKKK